MYQIKFSNTYPIKFNVICILFLIHYFVISALCPNKGDLLLPLTIMLSLNHLLYCIVTYGGHTTLLPTLVRDIFSPWWMITADSLGHTYLAINLRLLILSRSSSILWRPNLIRSSRSSGLIMPVSS